MRTSSTWRPGWAASRRSRTYSACHRASGLLRVAIMKFRLMALLGMNVVLMLRLAEQRGKCVAAGCVVKSVIDALADAVQRRHKIIRVRRAERGVGAKFKPPWGSRAGRYPAAYGDAAGCRSSGHRVASAIHLPSGLVRVYLTSNCVAPVAASTSWRRVSGPSLS